MAPALSHRFSNSQAKIALKAKSEDELLELEAIAKSLNLCARSVEDMLVVNLPNFIVSILIILRRGLTQVAHGSRTVLGIGPGKLIVIGICLFATDYVVAAPVELINQVTGKLRLL